MGTLLTLHRFTGEAGQRDRQSRLSSTQSRSRIEVGADHSLPNLPACTYLPVPTLPSTLEHQVCPTVQSSPVHEPQPPPPDAPSPRKQYIPGTVPSPSHPILIPSHPSTTHVCPQQSVRNTTWTTWTTTTSSQDRSAASVQVQVHVHVPKACRLPYLTCT